MFTLRVHGVEETSDLVRDSVLSGMRNGMEKIGVVGEQLVVSGTPVGATGNLAQSVFSEFRPEPMRMVEVIAAGPPADVYAAPVETGTRPHFPPVNALLLWVKQKFGITDESEARSVAFLVARKIARRGTQGARMFEQAIEKLEPMAEDILTREIAEEIRRAGLAKG